MLRILSVKLPLDYEKNGGLFRAAARVLSVNEKDIQSVSLYRRSVDARKGEVVYIATLDVSLCKNVASAARRGRNVITSFPPEPKETDFITKSRLKADLPPVVIGAGPAGLFCAYVLALNGLHPILLERGREVDKRSRDIESFNSGNDPDFTSNVLFGEGGAGTFSDGKLNTGITDSRCRFVLKTLAENGASEEILWQAMPHVGTDRLKITVKSLREKILFLGGEVRFENEVTDIVTEQGRLCGLKVKAPEGEYLLSADKAVFATGHSARDTYEMLFSHKLFAEPKAFAVGVRIEHRRSMIDFARYGKYAGYEGLGAASYKLVSHATKERGVYTFCMCPGGEVITCVSEKNGLSVNGMSNFARDGENSNSALLVGVSPADYGYGLTDGIELQRKIERAAFSVSGDYRPPAQLVGDFLQKRASSSFGDVSPSCKRGVTLCELRECLPEFVTEPIASALPDFGKKIRGFDGPDALLTGVEARSSSPVRLLRSKAYESSITGLYPCGEGAGFAGGITSAAVDGIRVAEAVIESLKIL